MISLRLWLISLFQKIINSKNKTSDPHYIQKGKIRIRLLREVNTDIKYFVNYNPQLCKLGKLSNRSFNKLLKTAETNPNLVNEFIVLSCPTVLKGFSKIIITIPFWLFLIFCVGLGVSAILKRIMELSIW